MIEMIPLTHDEKADGFEYAAALMSGAMQAGMDALINIKYKGFTTDFMITIHDCGNLSLLKRTFGKEYGLKRCHTTDYVLKKLEIKDEKTVLVQNSCHIYNLNGTVEFPLRHTIISGKPLMIFSNFRRENGCIHYDITLSIIMPEFISRSSFN